MRKLLTIVVGALLFSASALADVWQAQYGVARTFDFVLYNTDGTIDVDEVDGGAEVTLDCDGTPATATNDFVDEGAFYSIALTAAEMQCERITVTVGATDTNVFFIQTHGHVDAFNETLGWNTGDAFARLGAPAGASVSADLVAIDDFVDELEIRVTAARAGYLDNLNGHTAQTGDSFARLGAPAGASVSADLVVIDNFVDDIESRLTAVRAGYLDNLNGHTAQTGDSFARLGAPVGASLSADLQVIDGKVDDIETDTADMQPKLGTFPDLGAGATLAGNLEDMRDDGTATFDRTTDSLQAIRDRGDAAWTTGAGGSFAATDLGYHTTTIATLASQTEMTLTAGSADNAAYDGFAAIFIDQSTSTQQGLSIAGCTTPYVGSTRTLTLEAAPEFTIATGDTVILAPAFLCDGVTVTALGDNVMTAAATAPDYLAEINVEVDTALIDYDALVPADLPTNFADLSITATTGRVDVATFEGFDASEALGTAQTGDAYARLGAPVGASIAADIAAKPTAADNADAVWEELITDHSGTSGSTAEALNAAGSSGDPWTTALPGAYTSGQAGFIVGTNLNATVSSRASQTSLNTVDDYVDDLEIRLTALRAGYLDNLSAGAVATQSSVDGLNDLDAPGIRAAVGLGSPNLDVQLAALPTAAEITTAVLAGQVEDQGSGYDLKCALATLLSYAAGEWSQSGSVATYQDPSGTENRLVGTIAASSRGSITITCP